MIERCGVWVKVADHESVCMRWDGHIGPCLPLRSELMNKADWHEEQAAEIYHKVIAADELGQWPKGGAERVTDRGTQTPPTSSLFPFRDRTLSFTFGPWGGVWFKGGKYCWRLSLGYLAVTFFDGDFVALLDAWLKEGE